jgi:LL-diaminopimelate aminotransferase
MTGYRIGYILSNERVIKAFQNIKDNFDSGQFIPIQLGAMKALDNFKFLDKNKHKYLNRQIRLHEILTKYGFKYNLPKAGFFAYCKIPNKVDDIKMNNAYKFSMYLLKKYKIMTIPYDDYSSIRFSLTFKEDDNFFFKELDDRLSKIKFEFDWSE